MYYEFYGFKERPFDVTADPDFFFLSKRHREALSCLEYGIGHKKGIIAITGEIGTGKTTLCRVLLKQLQHNTKTAFILNPYFSELQLLQIIVKDFGIESVGATRLSLIEGLNRFLIEEARNRNNAVLIIDEAQELRPRQLEQIRLLSNLETEKEKLIQIVLVGQPELNQKLSLYSLRQLRQRITVKYHILSLQKNEVKEYILHRLKIAKPQKRITFNDIAVEQIYKFSEGTPRLINIICDRALMLAFIRGVGYINEEIIERTLEEIK
jgi:general secretion pathway protein A